MTLAGAIFTLAAGGIGLAAGRFVPKAGEKLMAYKVSKKLKEYTVYGGNFGKEWLYAVGVAFSWIASVLEPSPLKAGFFALLSYLMFVITYLDNRYRIIPNETVLVILGAGLIYGLAAKGLAGLVGSVVALVSGVLICAVAAMLTRGKGAVGAGDVKLMAVCCCVAGVPGFMNVLLYMAIALGVYCIGGLKTRRLTLNSYFPMGGFIAMGLVLSLYQRQLEVVGSILKYIITGG